MLAFLVCAALHGPPPMPTALPAEASASAEEASLDALVETFGQAEMAWIKEIQSAAPEDQGAIFLRHPAREFWDRFAAFAEQKEARAHKWLVGNASYAGKSKELLALGRAALGDCGENEDIVTSVAGTLRDNAGQLGYDEVIDVLAGSLATVTSTTNQGWLASTIGLVMLDTGDPEREAEGIRMLESTAAAYEGEEVGQHASDELFRFRNLAIGAVAPNFEGADIDGQALSLSAQRGKIVVVDFFGFW